MAFCFKSGLHIKRKVLVKISEPLTRLSEFRKPFSESLNFFISFIWFTNKGSIMFQTRHHGDKSEIIFTTSAVKKETQEWNLQARVAALQKQ